HLQTTEQKVAAGANSMSVYVDKYRGAGVRVERRGGTNTYMPNLPLTPVQVDKLIAFFRYTARLHTEGWPPKIKAGELQRRLHLAPGIEQATMTSVALTPSEPASASVNDSKDTTGELAERGAQLVSKFGCTACHATDASRKVGPGW